jgi:hypothetical protein
MNCIEFFRKNATNRERCKELQKLPEAEVLEYELSTASDYSPRPVESTEHLWRQILNPTHFDISKNELKVSAFSDVSSIGGSVNRGFADYNSLVQAAKERIVEINEKAPLREEKLLDLVRLECAEVRAISTNLNTLGGVFVRGFVVLDTATVNDNSHADICQIVSQPAQGRSVRSALLELANKYLISEGVVPN